MRPADSLHTLVERATRPRGSTCAPDEGGYRCVVCGGSTTRVRVFGERPWIARCGGCGTEALRPPPTAAELREYYDDYPTTHTDAATLRRLVDLNEAAFRHALLSVGRDPAELGRTSFLEVGFGNAASVIAAARLGASTTGIDLDPAGVERAAVNAAGFGVAPRLRCAEIAELCAAGDRFDLVKASHVIEHTVDPRSFLRSIARMQPEGALLLLECPNNKALFWLVKNALRVRMGRESFYNSLKQVEHLWGFTRDSLARLVESEGYRVLRCHDYPVGAALHQPETTIWYPGWRAALRTLVSGRGLIGCQYAMVRTIDTVASKLIGGGTGLTLVARREFRAPP